MYLTFIIIQYHIHIYNDLCNIQVNLLDYASQGQAQLEGVGEGLNLELGEILKSVYIALIVIGCIILIIAFLGCGGACCANKCMCIVVSSCC